MSDGGTAPLSELAVRVHTDGASRGNPGHAGIGVVVERAGDGAMLAEIAEYLGETTNNIAEYRALLAGLQRSLDLGATAVEVWSDSELMVRQVEGRYQVRHPALQPLHAEVARLRRRFTGGFRIVHTLRQGNRRADELANLAIERALGRERREAPAKETPAPAPADVFALAAGMTPGQTAPLGGGLLLARLSPGQARACGWALVLRGTVEVGGSRLEPGQCRRGGLRYRAVGDEDALVLETDSTA